MNHWDSESNGLPLSGHGMPSQGRAAWLLPTLVAAIVVVGGLLAWRVLTRQDTGNLYDPEALSREITPRGDLAGDERTTIDIFRKASPSVVHITRIQSSRMSFSLDPTDIRKGTGSGFIWTDTGYIVTNAHVVKGGGQISVTLADNSQYQARIVGFAPNKDLAVLKIDAPEAKLPPLHIGTSEDLVVGQKVFAIGNPFGLDKTLTTGIISGLDREIQTDGGIVIRDVIQTDAAINPGNSGGPLLDSAGRLIGVNTAIVSPTGAYAGIGFAVPVDIVNEYVPEIIQKGSVKPAVLGARFWRDSQVRLGRITGAVIRNVFQGGAAEKAGLRPSYRSRNGIKLGDIITTIDDHEVRSALDIRRILAQYKAGDTVQVTLIRDSKRLITTVTLGGTE